VPKYLFSLRKTLADLPDRFVILNAPNLQTTVKVAEALDLIYEDWEDQLQTPEFFARAPVIEVSEKGEAVVRNGSFARAP
jgi:hypothetical protein